MTLHLISWLIKRMRSSCPYVVTSRASSSNRNFEYKNMQLRTPLLKCTARFSSSLPDAYAFDEHIADVFEVGQLLFNLD